MSNLEFSVSIPEFSGFPGELVGVLLSGTITKGVLRLRLTADRVETPFSSAGQGLGFAGGKPADTEKIYRLISFPYTRDHNRAHTRHYRLILYARRRFLSKELLFRKPADGSHNTHRASLFILSST